jgi:hypothetical protein
MVRIYPAFDAPGSGAPRQRRDGDARHCPSGPFCGTQGQSCCITTAASPPGPAPDCTSAPDLERDADALIASLADAWAPHKMANHGLLGSLLAHCHQVISDEVAIFIAICT